MTNATNRPEEAIQCPTCGIYTTTGSIAGERLQSLSYNPVPDPQLTRIASDIFNTLLASVKDGGAFDAAAVARRAISLAKTLIKEINAVDTPADRDDVEDKAISLDLAAAYEIELNLEWDTTIKLIACGSRARIVEVNYAGRRLDPHEYQIREINRLTA